MGLLYPFLFILWALVVALTTLGVVILLTKCIGAVRRIMRKSKGSGPSQSDKGKGRGAQLIPAKSYPWPMLAAILGASSFVITATITTFPDRAGLRHVIDKLLGYKSTRIVLVMQQDDQATREALVATLRPFMEIGGRAIRYRVASGRFGNYGYTEAEDVPSYYRFDGGKMEIATGGIVSSDRLIMMRAGFESLARFPTVDSVTAHVPATVRIGTTQVAVEMQPRTARLISSGNTRKWTPTQPSSSAPSGLCYMEVQALFSSDAFKLLLAGAYVKGEVELQPEASLRDTRYSLVGLGLVSGERGRMVKEDEFDRTRIYGVLRLLPRNLRTDVMDCDLALPRLADPALQAASMLATFPELDGRIAGVEIRDSMRFSPWHERGGWTAVPSHSRAEAGERECEIEYQRFNQAEIEQIKSQQCRRDTNANTCALLRERIEWTRNELAHCRGQ